MTASAHSTKFAEALAAWTKGRERYASKLQQQANLSGITTKTVYTQDDLSQSNVDVMPGVFPFTRGLYPDGYALTPWAQQMVFGTSNCSAV